MTLKDEIQDAISRSLPPLFLLTGAQEQVMAEAVMKALRPHEDVTNTEPVICYFATEEDREEFIQAVMEAKPNMRSVKV